MGERVFRGDGWYELTARRDGDVDADRTRDFDTLREAEALVTEVADLAAGLDALRSVVGRVDLAADLSTLTDEAVKARAAWGLYDRELYADGRRRDTPGGGGGGNPTPGPKTDPPPPPTDQKTWIEIHLKNTDGVPLRGERYRLKLPDNTVREGSTNDAGAVFIEDIDPGLCELTFPDLDRRAFTRTEG
ncbi:MAG: hypothetical protein R3A52_17765 [Polyangiales bacterium]